MEPFFEKGNTEQIRLAKITYRRMYKANWRKAHRKVNKEINTVWNKEEYRLLKAEAKKHRLSVTTFIKVATVAYRDMRYIPLHLQEINKLFGLQPTSNGPNAAAATESDRLVVFTEPASVITRGGSERRPQSGVHRLGTRGQQVDIVSGTRDAACGESGGADECVGQLPFVEDTADVR